MSASPGATASSLIRRGEHIVQDRPLRSLCWAKCCGRRSGRVAGSGGSTDYYDHVEVLLHQCYKVPISRRLWLHMCAQVH